MSRQESPSRRIWVTRFVDSVRERTVDHPLLVGCLTLGAVPVVLTLAFFALTAGTPPRRFVVAHLLAMVVPLVGPSAIWYWDTRVFPQFAASTADIAVDPDAVERVTADYECVFSSRYRPFTAVWTTLIVGIIALNLPYFRTLGVAGVADPAFWVYLGFATWWGIVTGIGFHGALTAIRTIRAVGDLELRIDPLNPDGLGGLSSVGSLAIWTTMLISLGSLTLPLAFILGTEGGYSTLVYAAVGVYLVVIVVSFVYPTVYVNRRAQEIRETELEARRSKIRRLEAQAADLESPGDDAATMSEVATRLEIQRLRDEFTEYDEVNLYPLSVGILVRLVSSVLLPIFFILFETILGRFL
ncbi:MAG: hypothetical protein ABEJ06_01175 [Haloarculaceae archaeon]